MRIKIALSVAYVPFQNCSILHDFKHVWKCSYHGLQHIQETADSLPPLPKLPKTRISDKPTVMCEELVTTSWTAALHLGSLLRVQWATNHGALNTADPEAQVNTHPSSTTETLTLPSLTRRLTQHWRPWCMGRVKKFRHMWELTKWLNCANLGCEKKNVHKTLILMFYWYSQTTSGRVHTCTYVHAHTVYKILVIKSLHVKCNSHYYRNCLVTV